MAFVSSSSPPPRHKMSGTNKTDGMSKAEPIDGSKSLMSPASVPCNPPCSKSCSLKLSTTTYKQEKRTERKNVASGKSGAVSVDHWVRRDIEKKKKEQK